MTKKDYEKVAAVIGGTKFSEPEDKIRLVENLGVVLARDNPHFKKKTFEEACGVFWCGICEDRREGSEFFTTDQEESKAHYLIHLNES